MRRFFLFATFFGLSAVLFSAPLDTVWEKASRFEFDEARKELEKVKKEPGISKRSCSYAEAVLLLQAQPKTESNLNRAAEIFSRLVEEERMDEVAVQSRYHLARIEHLHRIPPDLKKAETLYRELIRDFPEHEMSQMAILKLLLITLYDQCGDKTRERKFLEAENMVSRLTQPFLRRDFHVLMSLAYLRFQGSKERALFHCLKADEIGIERKSVQGENYIRIGELSRDLGQREQALSYYRKFLEEFGQDQRCYMVRLRVEELQKGSRGYGG